MSNDPNNAGKTVTCLGGAGGMGKTLARHLSQLEPIDTLIIADLDGEAASKFADELKADARCQIVSQQVDILNEKSLSTLLAKTDFLANAAGPFFRLGVPTLRAAIKSGTPYLDICDDPEPTIQMMALDAEAKAAGVAALIGMGASPGLSNLMAKRAADRLDEVIDCYTAWPFDVEPPDGIESPMSTEADYGVSAALVHLMEQISGTIDSIVDGQHVKRKPLEPIMLDFPGMGKGTAITVGHPEPVTLHKSFNIKGRSANLMLVQRSTGPFLRSLGHDIDAGRLDLEEAAEAGLHPSILRTGKALIQSLGERGPGDLPIFFALLMGLKDGQRKAVGCHATALPAGMDGVTSIPAALAVEILLKHPAEAGVHAPENIIDPDTLLDRLCRYCPGQPASVDALMPVSEQVLD
ncbi:MAG: saccharopine dehydrogenase NADP-binding domain-containing protein [Pseudomonadota bacterium]